jgi:hypothetical protein
MGPEAKFYKYFKKNTPNISYTFHVRHPINSFILVQTPDACGLKLYEGLRIRELVACGLKLDACGLGLDACRLKLESL